MLRTATLAFFIRVDLPARTRMCVTEISSSVVRAISVFDFRMFRSRQNLLERELKRMTTSGLARLGVRRVVSTLMPRRLEGQPRRIAPDLGGIDVNAADDLEPRPRNLLEMAAPIRPNQSASRVFGMVRYAADALLPERPETRLRAATLAGVHEVQLWRPCTQWL